MKTILTSILFLTVTFCKAQLKLDPKDFNNLIAIAELYSNNTNATGSNFAKSIDSLRTPILNPLVDALTIIGKDSKSILETRFLSRPSDEELILWYVLREIHYNRIGKTKKPRPDIEVANEILSKKIDTRWLLDNYYYRIHSGVAMLFNEADLSKYDFNMNSLGFKDETEKAIFFLNMMDALVGARFKVLMMMKNNKKILEFCDKLPKFNGKEYYYYQDFDYEDFDWIGYDKSESYNERHIGGLYSTLITQFSATAELKDKKDAQVIYFNSILHTPKYFKFTSSKGSLQSLYDKSN